MSKRQFQITPFMGVISSLDPRALDSVYAADLLNVRVEDGTLRTRYGYRTISGIPSGFVAPYGLDYIQGYDSNNAEIEEFISFEDISGTCKPYSIHPTTGVRTVLTNGGGALNLSKSTWRSVAWQDKSYHINSNDTYPVYRHTIGTASSFTPLRVPTSPTARLTYTVKYGGTSTPYSTQTFTGINVVTHVTYTGRATSTGAVVNADGSFTFGRDATGGIGSDGSVDINFGTPLGDKDWTYNDIFAMSVTSVGVTLVPSSIKVTLYNSSGTALVPNKLTWVNTGGTGTNGIVRFEYSDKTRASFGAIRRIKFEFTNATASGNNDNNKITLGKPIIGGVWCPLISSNPWQNGLALYYTYYYSGADFESGSSPQLFVPNTVLEGISPGQNLPGLGVHLELTATGSLDSNVDNIRYYAFNPQATGGSSGMLRLGTQADSDLTFDYRISWAEVLRLTERTEGAYTLANVTCAAPFKGWMVWGYKGGYQNIRHSRIGEPEKQASPLDLVADMNRGATFSLADNFGDTPLAMFQAGDALIICGDYGVYAQVGDRPSTMTPPKKLPGSAGVANGFAACRWKDDTGNPGVVFVSKYGDGIWFAQVFSNFDGTEGYRIVELSQSIRGLLVSFLRDGQSLTDFSTLRIGVDEGTDSLWLIMKHRALVLRRASLVDGKRQWECYHYSTGAGLPTISYLAFSTKRRMVWMRSSGQLDENEYNSSSNSYIAGTGRDAGNVISSIYWKSKVFTGQNRRIADVYLERDDYANTPSVEVVSSRQTATKTLGAGKRFTRFSALQQGWEHQYKISLSENDSPIRRLVVTEYAGIGKRLES